MMQSTKRVGKIIAFLMVLLGLTLNVLFWGSQKNGFHGDELYSYHFICCTDYPSINSDREGQPYLNNWHEPAYYNDYYIISENERFDISGVIRSIKKDVHPPIFYMMLEVVISCFFPGVFTKWAGVLLNAFFYILTVTILYLFSKKLLRSTFWGMTTTLFYGVSIGAVSTVMFIRMYMILTMMSVLFLYLHYLLWEEIFEAKQSRIFWGLMIGIGLTLVFGLLTHYYFMVFAFFMCAFMTFWLFRKKADIAIKYVCIMFSSFVLAVLVWNDLILDILFSYRGRDAFLSVLNIYEWLGYIREYIQIIHNQISGIPFICSLMICIVVVLIKTFFFIRKKKQEAHIQSAAKKMDGGHMVVWQMLFAVIMDAVIIAIIAPYRTDRYIFNLLPAVVLLCLFALKGTIDHIYAERRLLVSVAVTIGLFTVVFSGYYTRGVGYLYQDYTERESLLHEYADRPALLITKNNERFVSCTSSFFLKDFSKTLVIKDGDYSKVSEVFDYLSNDKDGFVCFVSDKLDINSAVTGICKATGCENMGKLTDIADASVYVLGR